MNSWERFLERNARRAREREASAPRVGWRVFALDGYELMAPLTKRECGGVWKPGINLAKCWRVDQGLVVPHEAPHSGCFCGWHLTASLMPLHEYCLRLTIVDEQATIFEISPVLAFMRLEGVVFPASERATGHPYLNPPDTWRGERAKILALHFSPRLSEERVQLVTQRHPDVPYAHHGPGPWWSVAEAVNPILLGDELMPEADEIEISDSSKMQSCAT